MLGLALRQRGTFSPRMLFAKGEAGAWYDPSDLACLSQNSDGTGAAAVDAPVGRIMDRSGRGNHAAAPSAAARPMLRQDGAGRLYLEFDGVDDELRAGFACPQPWERVAAVRQLSYTANDRLFGGFSSNSGNLIQAVPGTYALSGGSGTGTGIVAAPLGENQIFSERHHGANSRLALNNGSPLTGDAGTMAANGISLASAGAAVGARQGHMRLYGIVMVGRTLSDGEGRRLRRYMAARAGVAL